jgi:hypothetical protein
VERDILERNQTGQVMSKKLIEAPNLPRRHKRRIYTEKEIELALAWLTGEVRYQGICRAVHTAGSTTYLFLAMCLFEAYQRGQLQITTKR